MSETKYTCPCCGYKTLDEAPPGTYDICPICFWEDDGIQFDDPDYEGGANDISLREAQSNFIKYGACEVRLIDNVRKPNNSDCFAGPKNISKIRRIPIEEMIDLFRSLSLPIEKLLDLYIGASKLNYSNMVFNPEQLDIYLTDEEYQEYFFLTFRDRYKDGSIEDNEKLNIILNITEEELEIRKSQIQKLFVRRINNGETFSIKL